MDANDFGFTNDQTRFALVRAYVAAAVADGWSIEPTYGTSESVDRAAKLTRDGFVMLTLAREYPAGSKWAGEARISMWAPDGLAIKPPDTYDWAAIQAGVRHCNWCDADDVETFRAGFAGRVCQQCLKEARVKYEFPGWTN